MHSYLFHSRRALQVSKGAERDGAPLFRISVYATADAEMAVAVTHVFDQPEPPSYGVDDWVFLGKAGIYLGAAKGGLAHDVPLAVPFEDAKLLLAHEVCFTSSTDLMRAMQAAQELSERSGQHVVASASL